MAFVNLSKRPIGEGYAYQETIATGQNGNSVLIPSMDGKEITCTIIAGAGTGKFQFTTSTDAAIAGGTEVWQDWPKGVVTGTDCDVIAGPITALRGVSAAGEVKIEIVR